MRYTVSPEILQLLTVGVGDSDDYLERGRHLRWLPNPMLGFPRRGFLLRRRPSPGWPWGKRTDMVFAFSGSGEKEGAALWLPGSLPASVPDDEDEPEQGVRATSPGQELRPDPDGLPVPDAGLMLELQAREGIARPNPAAWVAVRVEGDLEATVTASAWADAGPGGEDAVLSEVAELLGGLPRWDSASRLPGRVILLDGGLIDAVELHADGEVRVTEVQWLPAARYAAEPGWEEVGRFLLPLDGDGAAYPSQPDADDLAAKRVARGAPKAAPPWEEPAWPPPPGDRDEIVSALADRHLGRLGALQAMLGDVLATEVDQFKPQGSVRLDLGDGQALQLQRTGDEADLRVLAVPLLLGASMEAAVAHLLGLATVDREPLADVPYDYCVSAVYPSLWMAWLMGDAFAEAMARHSAVLSEASRERAIEEMVIPPLPPDELDEEKTADRFFRVASVATAVTQGPLTPVPAARELAVDVVADPSAAPVPARAELSWTGAEGGWFHPAPVVGFTASRKDPKGLVSLARTDPATEHPLPQLTGSGDQQLRDAALRVEGDTEWAVRQLDLWGRWGVPAPVKETVVDEVPPPPPSGVVAQLEGAVDESASTAAKIVVAFPWSAGQATLASDLDRFELALAAGDVDADDALAQGSVFEVAADASDVQPSGRAERDSDGQGGWRIEVGLPDAPVIRDGYRWVATAALWAVDAAGNRSRPASALAELVEEAQPTVPACPPDVQWTSWPDADGFAWWTCRWQAEKGVSTQVMRAAGARLLAAAGEGRSVLAGKSVEEQAAHLQGLAVSHSHAFAPDHPRSYGYPDAAHTVRVEGSSRDLVVLLVLPTGPTGTRADWPEDPKAFTVVAARRLDALAPPRLVATAQEGAVHLQVEAQPGPERTRLWCSADPSALDDLRRMRPLPPTPLGDDGCAELKDPAVARDTWYAYRATVETPAGRRSDPTAAVWVRVR